MDTRQAFMRGLAAESRGAKQKVFDWDAAARYIVEHGITEAYAGLSLDLGYTGGKILENGKPVPQKDTITYLASNWATPVLYGFTEDGLELPFWKYEEDTPGWDSDTYWPESALAILRGGK